MRTTKLPLEIKAEGRSRGFFGYQAVCSALTADGSDADMRNQYWGVSNYCNTQYGTFRGADGLFMNAQRMVHVESTNLFIVAAEGAAGFEADSDRGYIGRVVQRVEDGAWIAEGRPSRVSGEPKGGYSSEPLRLVQTADRFEWDEGELMSVSGPLVGAATQWFTPGPDGGMFFTGHPHRVSGTCLGKAVEGFAFNDQMYLPIGDHYGSSAFFQKVHVAFVMWGTEYEDGTVEAGQIGLGHGKFAFAVFSNAHGPFVETTNVTATLERDDDGYPTYMLFDVAGEPWEWVSAENSALRQFGPEYRGAEGLMRRVGEQRKPRVWMGYMESFKSRG